MLHLESILIGMLLSTGNRFGLLLLQFRLQLSIQPTLKGKLSGEAELHYQASLSTRVHQEKLELEVEN